MEGFRVSSQTEEMDLPFIHEFLSRTYWANGIPLETLQKAVHNSICFGVLEHGGGQVGFARVVTDTATFAYLADVFIAEAYRGRGLSRQLMESIVAHPQLQGLRRFTLATRDAHGLYEQFGFKPLANPKTFMEVWRPDVYSGE